MNAITWFEIPATDFERAVKFYGAVHGTELEAGPASEGAQMAMLPSSEDGVGGAITYYEAFKPGPDGPLVYLNGGADLSVMLDRVEGAGGKVLTPKTSIGEHGYYALFLDSEGNRVGLHSMG